MRGQHRRCSPPDRLQGVPHRVQPKPWSWPGSAMEENKTRGASLGAVQPAGASSPHVPPTTWNQSCLHSHGHSWLHRTISCVARQSGISVPTHQETEAPCHHCANPRWPLPPTDPVSGLVLCVVSSCCTEVVLPPLNSSPITPNSPNGAVATSVKIFHFYKVNTRKKEGKKHGKTSDNIP